MAKSSPHKSARSKRTKSRLVSSRTVYRGPVFWVTTDHVEEPGGVDARRDIIHHSGSVVVLGRGRLRARRLAFCWSASIGMRRKTICGNCLPAASIPASRNSTLRSANCWKRPDTRARKWKRILKFYASPGFVAETMSVFLATGLRAGEAQPEEDEIIYKRLVPLPAAVSMAVAAPSATPRRFRRCCGSITCRAGRREVGRLPKTTVNNPRLPVQTKIRSIFSRFQRFLTSYSFT